jgi:hypothetical protein
MGCSPRGGRCGQLAGHGACMDMSRNVGWCPFWIPGPISEAVIPKLGAVQPGERSRVGADLDTLSSFT